MDKPTGFEQIRLLFKCNRSLRIHATPFLFHRDMPRVNIQCMARNGRRDPTHVRMCPSKNIKIRSEEISEILGHRCEKCGLRILRLELTLEGGE